MCQSGNSQYCRKIMEKTDILEYWMKENTVIIKSSEESYIRRETLTFKLYTCLVLIDYRQALKGKKI